MAETCFATDAGVRPSMPTTIAIRWEQFTCRGGGVIALRREESLAYRRRRDRNARIPIANGVERGGLRPPRASEGVAPGDALDLEQRSDLEVEPVAVGCRGGGLCGERDGGEGSLELDGAVGVAVLAAAGGVPVTVAPLTVSVPLSLATTVPAGNASVAGERGEVQDGVLDG